MPSPFFSLFITLITIYKGYKIFTVNWLKWLTLYVFLKENNYTELYWFFLNTLSKTLCSVKNVAVQNRLSDGAFSFRKDNIQFILAHVQSNTTWVTQNINDSTNTKFGLWSADESQSFANFFNHVSMEMYAP